MQQSTRFRRLLDRRRYAMAIVVLAATVAFLPALAGGFVYDDEWLVRDNANLHALLGPGERPGTAADDEASHADDRNGGAHIRALLFSDFSRIAGEADTKTFERTGYFRPVIAASYLVDGFFWSNQGATGFAFAPFGFHLTNLLLHVAVSLLVCVLARCLAGGPAGLITGVLFAVHPIHTENVAWIAGRTDLVAALFGMASLVCCCRFLRPSSTGGRVAGIGWLGCAVVLFALATLSKESALFLPLVALIMGGSHAVAPPASRAARRRRFVPGVTLAGVAVAYCAARLLLTSPTGPADAFIDAEGEPLAISTLAASFIRAIGWYAAKFLWPASFEPHADVAFATPGQALLPLVVHIAILAVAAALLASRRTRTIGIGVIGAYLALLPVSCIAPGTRLARAIEDQMFPVAERFLYLPSAFGLLAAGAILARCIAGRLRWPVIGAITVLAVVAAATTWSRAQHYRTNTTFFAAARETAPRSIRVRCGLGRVALDAWDVDEALDQFRFARHLLASRRTGATYPPIDAGLAAGHREKGDEPRLVEVQKRLMHDRPRASLPPFRLGITHWVNAVIHKDIARLEFAIAMVERARHLAPNDADIGRASDHLARTRTTWKRYYEKHEFSEAALLDLARTFTIPAAASLNEPAGPRWGDALKIFHRALIAIPPVARLTESPKAAAVRRDLERRYAETMTAAVRWYERTLERHPKSAVLHHQLGEILGIAWLRGNDDAARSRALEHFARCLDLAPGFLRAVVDEAALLKQTGEHAAAIARVRTGVRALLQPRRVDGWLRPMRPYEALDAIRFTAASPELPPEWRTMAAEMIEEVVEACRRRAEAGAIASDWDDLGWVLVYAGRTLGAPARYLAAKRAFGKALECDPSHARARTNLRALEAELAKGPPK